MTNANIILSGQQVQPLNALMQGTQAAQTIMGARRERDMSNMLQQHGAGIMAGDQQALNQLAQYDPQAALGIQSTQLGQQQTRQSMKHADQSMAMLSREEERQIQAQAAQMSAEQRAQEAAQIEQGVAQALQAQTPEQWDAIVQQYDPSLVGQFENREMIAGRYMSIADSLKRMDAQNATVGDDMPASVRTLQFRAEQAGLEPGTPEYMQFMADGGLKNDQMVIESDGEGGFTMRQGAGVANTPPKMTVDAAKNTGFFIRTQEANAVLNGLESQGTDFWQQAADSAPLGLGNYARTPEFQKFDQARRDFVNAILRRESGAVISDQEFDNANKQYFPVPGDGPEVIAQKRRNRETAIQGLEIGSGPGAAFVSEQQAQGNPPESAAVPDFTSMEPAAVQSFDLSTLDLAGLEAWNAYMDQMEAGQ